MSTEKATNNKTFQDGDLKFSLDLFYKSINIINLLIIA